MINDILTTMQSLYNSKYNKLLSNEELTELANMIKVQYLHEVYERFSKQENNYKTPAQNEAYAIKEVCFYILESRFEYAKGCYKNECIEAWHKFNDTSDIPEQSEIETFFTVRSIFNLHESDFEAIWEYVIMGSFLETAE